MAATVEEVGTNRGHTPSYHTVLFELIHEYSGWINLHQDNINDNIRCFFNVENISTNILDKCVSIDDFYHIVSAKLSSSIDGNRMKKNELQLKFDKLFINTLKLLLSPDFVMFLNTHMSSFGCGAHDIKHVYRVANLASHIASTESANIKIVYFASLVHDLLDSKLQAADKMLNMEKNIAVVLQQQNKEKLQMITEDDVIKIIDIIKLVGYKNLIKDNFNPKKLSIEYQCVQDADLLDAIGSVGIARCFAYGGKLKRTLFGNTPVAVGDGESSCNDDKITHEQYMKSQQSNGSTGSQHFFEKLLLLHTYMSTSTGEMLAVSRHNMMVDFLLQADSELIECCDEEGGRMTKRLKKM